MSRNDVRRADAVVVGAGLAGLACAYDLSVAGLDVLLLESSDAVGGRMRTDVVNGFRLDRGFQVFNTSYPQVKRRLRLSSLGLCPLTPGFVLDDGRTRARWTDPTRDRALPSGLRGRSVDARDPAALALLSGRDMFAPAGLLRHSRDRSTREALARAGFTEAFVDAFFTPFVSGIVLEDRLETSSRYFHLLWRSMLRGTVCLPRTGIQAVPEQLAASLPPGVLQLDCPVRELTPTGVSLQAGGTIDAPTVVVATTASAAAGLLPGVVEAPQPRAVTTYYHAVERTPLAEPALLVDGTRAVLNSVVLSEVSSDYSADGRALVATSVLGADADSGGDRVKARLADLYRTDTSGWELLRAYAIPEALPAFPSGRPLIRSARVAPGRYVCGDHRATPSVQGALASGARAAREILADRAGFGTTARPAA